MKVMIRKNNLFHLCKQTGNTKYKCGYCGRGNILPSKYYRCAVCAGEVAQVIKDKEFALPVWEVTPSA